MDGIHDTGGRQGFGKVDARNDVPFHEHWETRMQAINARMGGLGIFNMDEYRHAIERMEPRHYMSASYYERVFTAVVTLCVEKGKFSAQALDAAAGEHVPLALPAKPGRAAPVDLPALSIGDMVRVKNEFVAGHVRMPAYIRGMTGRIVSQSPAYPFPDAAAHGIESRRQCTFDVCFRSRDLWPEGSEDAEVCVGVFHPYLEKVG